MRLLFLGAGKRLSLFERFVEAGRLEGEPVDLVSYETSHAVPVSAVAEIVVGHGWDEPAFAEHLINIVRDLSVDAVIPCMDGATVALSHIAADLERIGCDPVVSSHTVCTTFDDKRLAEQWFIDHGVWTPTVCDVTPFPWIVKPAHGFGARGQIVVRNQREFDDLRIDVRDYVVQPFITGTEYTVDAYVSKDGTVLGCVPRVRLETVNGEVVRSVTRRVDALVKECTRILATGDFRGPITLQAIEHRGQFWFIEINTRFGGGVILSIEAGADYPRLLLRELLGRRVAQVVWRDNLLMMRAYREIFCAWE